MTQMQSIIRSVGLPPERHADRVVAEMLRELARKRSTIWTTIDQAISSSSDGCPKAQRKMEERVKRAGAQATTLYPGKRGRYELVIYDFTGWDCARDAEITVGDAIPQTPWIACNVTSIKSYGNGREETDIKSAPYLFITHHALSRTAQRLGMRTQAHLLTAVHIIWNSANRFIDSKGGIVASLDAPRSGWRAPLEARPHVNASVVLQRHYQRKALVAATVITEDANGKTA